MTMIKHHHQFIINPAKSEAAHFSIGRGLVRTDGITAVYVPRSHPAGSYDQKPQSYIGSKSVVQSTSRRRL